MWRIKEAIYMPERHYSPANIAQGNETIYLHFFAAISRRSHLFSPVFNYDKSLMACCAYQVDYLRVHNKPDAGCSLRFCRCNRTKIGISISPTRNANVALRQDVLFVASLKATINLSNHRRR